VHMCIYSTLLVDNGEWANMGGGVLTCAQVHLFYICSLITENGPKWEEGVNLTLMLLYVLSENVFDLYSTFGFCLTLPDIFVSSPRFDF